MNETIKCLAQPSQIDESKFPSRAQVVAAQELQSYGNDVLYRMCKENPLHQENDVIFSKVWLIGRSYAVAVERNKDKISQEEIYQQISQPGRWTSLERQIGQLSGKTVFNDINTLRQALSLHKALTDLFHAITRQHKRSLASKYLHFHCPESVYIYDSEVNAEINRIIKRPPWMLPGDYDDEYKRYAMKAFLLANEVYSRYGIALTPRHLDTLLQNIHHHGNFVQ